MFSNRRERQPQILKAGPRCLSRSLEKNIPGNGTGAERKNDPFASRQEREKARLTPFQNWRTGGGIPPLREKRGNGDESK